MNTPTPIAVIDIGSNTIRLVVYDRPSRSPFPRFNEKSMCGLGRDLNRGERLSEAAIDCTLRAVRRFVGIAKAMRASQIHVIATEAVRRAENGPALARAITQATGCEVRILSGDDEAYMAALGVASGFYRAHGLMGDLGGGSLELCSLHQGEVATDRVSLPLGALRVEALLADGFDAAKEAIDARLKPVIDKGQADTFYPVGGGWRALARVHMTRAGAPLHNVHGYEIPIKDARALTKELRALTQEAARDLPGVPSRRAAQVPAAALVLDRVLKRLAPERIVFSALGVREGWLYAALPDEDRADDPLIAGARDFGRPRARVPSIGAAMLRFTEPLGLDETAYERRLREAACELSDIAWPDHPDGRALDVFHRLSQLPFVGIDHKERACLAATVYARYNGDANAPAVAAALALLDGRQVRRAFVLGAALHLGYRFSGSVPEVLDRARLRLGTDAVILEVSANEALPDSEPVRVCLKRLAKALKVPRTEIRVMPKQAVPRLTVVGG